LQRSDGVLDFASCGIGGVRPIRSVVPFFTAFGPLFRWE